MSRVCSVLNKSPMSGNNVSHANNKTKRRFLPNLQAVSFFSEELNKSFKFRLSAKAIKTIDYKGGLDLWLQNTKNIKLPTEMKKIKKLVLKKQAN